MNLFFSTYTLYFTLPDEQVLQLALAIMKAGKTVANLYKYEILETLKDVSYRHLRLVRVYARALTGHSE